MSGQSPYNDKQLLTRIVEGDESAFENLFHHYYKSLYSSALRYVKSEFWAEEVVQEVFIFVWRDRAKLTGIENPLAWLRRLVWNKAIDRIRQQEKEMKAQYTLRVLTQAATDMHPDDQREKLLVALDEAIEQLSPQRKSVYLLRYQEKLSLDDIAQRLDLSRNSVRNYLVEAQKKIREYLLQHVDLYMVLWLCHHFF